MSKSRGRRGRMNTKCSGQSEGTGRSLWLEQSKQDQKEIRGQVWALGCEERRAEGSWASQGHRGCHAQTLRRNWSRSRMTQVRGDGHPTGAWSNPGIQDLTAVCMGHERKTIRCSPGCKRRVEMPPDREGEKAERAVKVCTLSLRCLWDM